MDNIPKGLCQCGCGGKTEIAKYNCKRAGYIKGEPLKYVRGHSSRVTPCQNVSPNPGGLCLCGCGQKTRLSLDNEYGNVTGEPRKFLHGHMFKNHETHPSWKGGRKKCCSGRYVAISLPDHPRADKEGYVLEHIVIVEKALGKPLPLKAKVHHADGNGTNNENSNLVACENHAYHFYLHQRMKTYEACGHAGGHK